MAKPIPADAFLHNLEHLGYIHGDRRWRDAEERRLFTWDSLHGEVEGFDLRGHHVGAFDPVTRMMIKPPVRGRRITV